MAIVDAVDGKAARLSAFFGHAPTAATNRVELYAVSPTVFTRTLRVGKTTLESDRFPSLTPDCPQVHLFEREIAEQCGVVPRGILVQAGPLSPFVSAGPRRLGSAAAMNPVIGVTDFFRVEGEEVHEVAVGPVHAGVIEPGHFRFQCHGEQVFHLEISLGYQHRGVERALVGGPNKRTIHTMETLAGDTSIGHATAYCQAVEALAGCQAAVRARCCAASPWSWNGWPITPATWARWPATSAFLPTASYCGRIRGDFLNLTALLCGSRFGRGLIRPGGVGFDLDDERNETMPRAPGVGLQGRGERGRAALELDLGQARFEDTGAVSRDACMISGWSAPRPGPAASSATCARISPPGIFRFAQVPVSTWTTGDVFARAYVRWLEIQRSVAFIREQLQHLPDGRSRQPVGPLKPDQLVVVAGRGLARRNLPRRPDR